MKTVKARATSGGNNLPTHASKKDDSLPVLGRPSQLGMIDLFPVCLDGAIIF